jgi:hypothetical protein
MPYSMAERITMLKKMVGCVREYKKPTFLTLIFIVLEAIIETLNSIVCNEIAASYDALSHTYKIAIKVKKEALI